MKHASIALSGAVLLLLGAGNGATRAALQLKEETTTIEANATDGTASIHFAAESESPLGSVEIRDPAGRPVLTIGAPAGQALALGGFSFETAETSVADALLDGFPAGLYAMHAETVDGTPVRGAALLTHDLPPAPVVVYPRAGDLGVPTDLDLSWLPDPGAAAWRLVLEQGENDGLTVRLPGDRSSFHVPDGVLAAGTETHLELAAVLPDGNSTLVEVVFTTR